MNTEILWAILTSSLFATVVTAIISFIKDYFRSRKRDRIIFLFIVKFLATDALFSKSISTEDLKCLEDAYTEYKALGGNGFADTLMRKVRDLPIWEDENEVSAELRQSHR